MGWVTLRQRALICAGLLQASLTLAHADDREVAEFYRGKTITFLIGTAAGAGYDLVGRAIAAHLGAFIPGHPSIIVQNMPGAGSLTMMNTLYGRSPRDGTFIGLPLNGVLLENRLHIYGRSGGSIGFDVARMSWIGSPMQEPQIMWAWHAAPIRSFGDLRGPNASAFGATSPTADNYLTPLLAKRLLGANLKLITGYQAVSDIFVAAERGEIVGNSTPFASLALGKKQELATGQIRVLAQFGSQRLPQLPDVPTGMELASDEPAKRLLQLWSLKFRAAYPIALPPGVPQDRVAALQAAFTALMRDHGFRADAEKMQLQLAPLSGRDIAALLDRFARTDQSDLLRLQAALRPE